MKPAWLRVVREGPIKMVGGAVTSPAGIADLLRQHQIHLLEQESFYVILLGARNGVRGIQEVTRGLINCAMVHPREVFRLAIVQGATSIIVAHNHPTGNPVPSGEDRAITTQLVAAGKLLDIPVLDHVIVAGDKHFSFAEAGEL